MLYLLAPRNSPTSIERCENVSPYATNAGIELGFKGTHRERVRVLIDPTLFEEMAQAMMKANLGQAIKAFGLAMAGGIQSGKPPDSMYYVSLAEQRRLAGEPSPQAG
jgi:hypothetical protein